MKAKAFWMTNKSLALFSSELQLIQWEKVGPKRRQFCIIPSQSSQQTGICTRRPALCINNHCGSSWLDLNWKVQIQHVDPLAMFKYIPIHPNIHHPYNVWIYRNIHGTPGNHMTPVDADGKAVPLLRSPTFNTTDVCMREQTSNLNPRIL